MLTRLIAIGDVVAQPTTEYNAIEYEYRDAEYEYKYDEGRKPKRRGAVIIQINVYRASSVNSTVTPIKNALI